jgi:hypothetical protein
MAKAMMIILAAVTAHETKPSALVGAPPLALVSSGLDPVSGGALSVSTLVDQKYAHLIANFAHHMHAALPTVRYNVLTIDAAAQRQCQSFAGPSFKMTCLAAFPVETRNKTFVRRPSDKNHYADPVFLYKTIITRELAIHTNFGGGSVLLDITAFVLSEACWAELLHQNADFVVTVSNGMKSDFFPKARVGAQHRAYTFEEWVTTSDQRLACSAPASRGPAAAGFDASLIYHPTP